ncbi:carbohydrate kinase family protein [Hyphomicrobium sp. LHD-15]|uniref:carbohydrate kinase family protein n=1 Tax=Hyphomicrobium sp. LHD-15 TaxID=3072142 RepID=UPI00280DDA25|nr:carbohydrate kinase family protein [Hyphomicrobium sp. LHD-15]MDQ8697664.1 carbohydrate kinase family protein [Hyphomicrobium sp. LHD-15]
MTPRNPAARAVSSSPERDKARLRVLTVGGAMIDTIAIIESAAIERMSLLNAESSFLLLEEGRKTEALEVSTHCGGGAINAAVALARLGHDCSVVIKLGDDLRADQILARLDSESVSHRWASRDKELPTGASVLLSSHDRNAAVFTFRGANTHLVPRDFHDEAFAVDLVYIANLSNEAAVYFPTIVTKAKQAGALVAANPGPRQLHAHGDAFRAMLPHIGILALNRREALEVIPILDGRDCDNDTGLAFPHMVRPPPLAENGLHHHGRTISVRGFLRALTACGVGTAVITDGRDGAFAASAGRLFYCPASDAHVAGTAGAGDAFASTFSAYIAEGAAPDIAIRAATLNAASVLGHVDTQTGLMRRREIAHALDGKKPTPNVIDWPL